MSKESKNCDASVSALQARLEQTYGSYSVERTGPRSAGALFVEPDLNTPLGALRMRQLRMSRPVRHGVWKGHHFLIKQVSGRSTIHQSGGVTHLVGDDLILVRGDREFVMDVPDESSNFTLHLSADLVPADIESVFSQKIVSRSPQGRLLGALACSAMEAAALRDSSALIGISRLVIDAIRRYGAAPHPPETTSVIELLRQWVVERLDDPTLSPKTLADRVQLSERQLYRLFAQYDLTPGGWIWELRLSRAHELVRASPMSLTNVAFRSGFNDSAHFSRAFRRRFGQSPRSLRRGDC